MSSDVNAASTRGFEERREEKVGLEMEGWKSAAVKGRAGMRARKLESFMVGGELQLQTVRDRLGET